jgi:hypothetical protein
MGANDVTKVLRAGGQLIKNPTNLGAAYPYGGTELGVLDDVVLQPVFTSSIAKGGDDKFANQTVEGLYLGESWILGVSLRQFDADVVGTLFPNVGTVGPRKLSASTVKPGYRLSNRSCVLLFKPENPEHPSVLLYRVLPVLDETAALVMKAIDELTFPAVFHAIPNTSGHVYAMDVLANLSLTP